MFTQCSKCETVYRLSAEVLRAAGGQVRCGHCGDVFNALARLAENATGFKKGESALDLEIRADNILHSVDAVAPVDTMPPPGSMPRNGNEIARLEFEQPVGEDLASEESLEFTLTPGDLDRVFIETSPSVIQFLAAESAVAPAPAPTIGAPASPTTSPSPASSGQPAGSAQPTRPLAQPPSTTSAAGTNAATALSVRTPHAVPAPAEPLSPDAALALSAAAAAVAAVSDSIPAAPSTKISGLEVSEKVRLEMLSSFTHAELPPINPPRRQLPFALWVVATVLLTVLLFAQLILGNRDWLAVHAPLALGGGTPPANLSAYQLRQWGVTGDPAAKGTLQVRASIMNSAAQMEPYPLLRLSLANRFGTRIGQREFEPADYLGKPTSRMLSPGEHVDATLDIVDPGKDAEGFEIDICLRGTNAKIICVGDPAAIEPAAADAAAQAK